MRFLTLLRKELRECLPWMLLAAAALFVFGGIGLWEKTTPDSIAGRYPRFAPGSVFSHGLYGETSSLVQSSILAVPAIFLFLTSIGLGIALGSRQFWVDNFAKTWGFTLHRSIARQTILWAKLTAAVITFILSLGMVWTIFYWYAWHPKVFAIPPTVRAFIEGWVLISLGLVIYLGTALAGLSRARWYTTRMLGPAVAFITLIIIFDEWKLLSIFVTIIVVTVIILLQVIDTFLSREF